MVEGKQIISMDKMENAAKDLVLAMGYPLEGDLEKTPERVAKMWYELLTPEKFELTDFETGGYNGMIVQGRIPFVSICRHHLLPFYGTASVGYLPKGKIVGLSKLARTVEHFSKALQTQEYMTMQIADFLFDKLDAHGVGVYMEGRHMCMEIRGVEKPAVTYTQWLRGNFHESAIKEEFMQFALRG